MKIKRDGAIQASREREFHKWGAETKAARNLVPIILASLIDGTVNKVSPAECSTRAG